MQGKDYIGTVQNLAQKYLLLHELKELSVACTNISEDCIDDLVGKLTTKIEKLSLQELKSVNDV